MKLERKHIVILALVYAIYCVILCFLIDPFIFLGEKSSYQPYVLLFGLIGTLSCIGLYFTSRSVQGSKFHLFFVSIVYCTPLIAAIVIRSGYGAKGDFFLYLSTFLIIPILPIALYILWIFFQDLQSRVTINAENRETHDQNIQPIFSITNDKNTILLEIPVNKIIAFEANDNYVVTYHLTEDEKLKKSMHRISLKKITELLIAIQVEFPRIHKSYLINPHFLKEVKGKSQAYRIRMKHLTNELPVSRSFDLKQITGRN